MSTIERICSHIAATPASTAISQGTTKITYGELGAAASALARAMRERGVGAGSRVAITGSRSPRLVVAQVACLLVGAAFVPIDAAAPAARRADLVRLARPDAIVDADATLSADEYDAPVITFPASTSRGGTVRPPRTDPDRPVYVIFTSGSTGRPKAVVVSDRGLDNLVSAFVGPLFDAHGVSTVGVVSPFTFDASIKMTYGALTTGRTLHIITEDERDDVATMGGRLTAAGVDALDGTPSYLAVLAAQDPATAPALACILVGGEPLSAELADALAGWSGAQVVNVYGPTEATVDATSHTHVVGAARVPIGAPIAGVDVRIARGGRLVAVGQPGEIHIGGAGVALGYLDDADLTAERFVVDPFGPGSGRFYRTGDLGRKLRDGTIEYLGRMDEQLKVRGHRVEPVEIERVLAGIGPIVSAGVVVVKHRGTRLVAVCTAPVELDGEAVMAAAADLLPTYMLPTSVVQVDALPLSANGKLDRRTLAAVAVDRLGSDDDSAPAVEPVTDADRAVLAALREVLPADAVDGAHLGSSLVALGGDSISAIRLVAALARSGYRTSVRNALAAPSLVALAAECVRIPRTAAAATIDQAGPVHPTPVITDFFSRGLAEPRHHHQSILVPLSDDEHERVPAALDALLDRHRVLAAAVTDGRLVVPADGEVPPMVVAGWDLTGRTPADVETEAARRATELMAGHAWTRGPQLQAAVLVSDDVRAGHRRRELFVAAHHLVVDAISWSTIERDLRAALADPAARVVERTGTPFRAWAERLAAFGRSPEAERDRALWQATMQRAAGSGAAAAIEAARGSTIDQPETTTPRRSERLSFDVAQVPALAPGRRDRGTARPEEVLIAAVARAAEATWGVAEVPLLIESHGRPDDIDALADCDVTSTVGWFTTVYPVVVSAGPRTSALRSARSALRRVPRGGLTAELLFPGAVRGSGVGVVNYLGSLVGGSGLNPLGSVSDPGNAETHPFVVDAWRQGDEFVVDVSLRIDALGTAPAERFVTELRSAVVSTGTDRTRTEDLGAVPADHGENDLTIAEFDTLPGDAGEILPVSNLQAGLLFEHLASADEAHREHVVQVSYRLDAPFDADRLTRTVQALFDDVPALRTTFHWEGLREPHQVVRRHVEPIVRITDLTGVDEATCADRIAAISAERRAQTFDLGTPTLFVTDVFATDNCVRVTFTHHHIILDGWSLAEVVRRFTAHHHGAGALEPVPSTSDHLAWTRTRDADVAREYWGQVFSGLTAGTTVQSARGLETAIAGRSRSGAGATPAAGDPTRIEVRSDTALAVRVSRAFAPLGVSTSNVVEAALATVLARMNGSRDAVFGVVLSGRDAPVRDVERMVGLFINTVPRRVRVDGCAPVSSLALSVRDQALASAEFSTGPLSASLAEVGPDSAFDCLFTFENYEGSDARDADVLRFDGAVEQTNYPLTVTAEIDGDELLLTAIRDPRVLDDADAHRILRALRRVLESFADAPDRPVSSVSSVPVVPGPGGPEGTSGTSVTSQTSETSETSETGRIDRTDRPRDTLATAFADSARTHARSIALVDATRTLTYEDVMARATRVARLLRASGVSSGNAVGVADLGVDGIVAIIGTVLAGAVYVPLDARTPTARARLMFEQADVHVVLASQPGAHERVAGLSSAGLVVVDASDDARRDADEDEDASNASDGEHAPVDDVARQPEADTTDSDGPAYVMYTSGTTGTPKGVVVPHRAVLRLAVGNTHLPFDSSDVVIMTSSLAFDASTLEIWSTLLNGGSLIVGDRDEVLDPDRVRGAIARHGATTMWLTVSLFNQFVAEDATVLRGLRRLVTGGERVSADHVARAYAACPDLVVLNGYGPTENTTFTTVHAVPRGVRARDEVPIGTPLQGTSVIIRDVDGRTCGVGEPGELVAAGAGVALGYVGDPDGTAAAFEPDPDRAGLRYRTGDRARWLDDGTVEYLGRTTSDSQVKVRGFRVEIREVERVLRAVDDVRDAVVRPHVESNLSTALVAYVVVHGALDQARIRADLAERLPEYMVPAYLVALEALPLTTNGKIDETALPEPVVPVAGQTGGTARVCAGREDPALTTTLDAFGAALGRPVSPDENFFELGGDSIKAIRVVSVIRQRGFTVSVSAVMRGMTARRLATGLRTHVVDARADVAEGRVIPTPIVTEFERWDLADPSHFNQDVTVELTGATTAQIRAASDELWTRHGALRAVFTAGALVVRPGTATYPFAEYAVDDVDADDALHERASALHSSFSLADGPLFGVVVIRSEVRVRVVLAAHHLVVDAVSWGILTDELVGSVRERMSGVAGGSRRSTTTLRSFADSLAEIGRHPSPRADRFWQEVDRAAAAALPRFSPRADAEAQAQARGRARATVQLERTLAPGPTQDSVRAVMRAYGASGEDLLLAALARAFERITGQTQIAVRLERHGRSETRGLPATDRTVGWFTTMYPLVVTAVADPGDAVAAVKDAVRAVPEDGVTYGLRPAGYADITTPLTVNYLGDLGRSTVDGFGSTVFNSAGTSVSPTNAFLPGVRANAMILDSRLVLRISHETTVASEAQVERLADAWLREVEAIGEHCAGIGPRIRTAADFPDAVELTRHDIDVIERFPEHVEDAVELTPLQEGMLVHSLAGGTDYVVQQSYLVADPLRSLLTPSRLATAALAVAARHDALRSAFVTDSLSRPLQFVLAERDVPVAWDDLRGRSATSADIDGLLASDVAHGFDPATDPLLRIRVVRSDATDSTGSAVGEETRLVLTMHHLAVDGWSLSHILSELVDGCRSLAAGASAATVLDRARERRSATAQPRDQVRWIRDQDDGAFTAFWADTLAGYEATAEFTSAGRSPVLDAGAAPNSTTDPSVDAHGVGRLESATASDLRRRLDAAHASSGITVSNLVHAAFALVLGRESGSDDVVFGSVVSGRDHDVSGLADAVGLFINTIPVRVQLAPHLSTDDLLRSVRDQALGSADHAYGSLRTVEDAADLHGSVRCLLAFENHEDRDPAALGLRFDQSREQTNYPVTVAVRPVGDDLAITVLYDSGTITHSDAERIRGRLELVLEQFATDTTRPVSAIRTLDDLHEREVLWCFGANEVPYDRDQTVVDAFLAHARVHPTDVAIVMGEAEYDFATVADAARAVAVAVAARVPRGGRVGLLTTRGPRTAVAMIGTMMAGCAFVALDVDSPDARLLDVLADAAPAVVLTDGDVAHDTALRVTAETRVIRLDGVLEDGPGGGALDPDRLPAPDDVAYCVYTSGSTGRPKGVVLTHRGLANLRAHLRQTYAPQSSDRVLQFANSVFDASVWELTLSVLSGAALVVVPKEMLYETDLLEAELRRTGVTLGLLPPHYYVHLDSVPMRILTTGGGASSPAVVEKARSAGVRYVNAFGPSETTVLATGWEDPGDGPVPSRIPIGRPVANTHVVVVVHEGSHVRLCGVGEVGELCVAGDGVAQGYLGLPEETARAFVPSPFSDGPLYRTGDRVRWLHDGMLDFLGRIADSGQVKVRGHRVEVAEVEAGVRRVPGVRDAVVVASPTEDGATLTAYAVFDDAREPVLVQRALRDLLPGYMIPQAVVPIDVIPLNRSGKVDRSALTTADTSRTTPQPTDIDGSGAGHARGDDARRTSVTTTAEQAVIQVFRQVLVRQDVTLDDNVFEIGGDSIKAIRIVSALRAAGFTTTARDVMGAMTPRAIAPLLRTAAGPRASQGVVTGVVGGTAMVEQFFAWDLAVPDHFNQDLLMEIGVGARRATIEQVAAALSAVWYHHDALRAVVRADRLHLRDVAEAGAFPLESVETSADGLDGVLQQGGDRLHRGLDLVAGPLARALLVSTPHRQCLVIVAHHLVVDLVSWQVIAEDLRTALDQAVAGEDITLPAKTASLREWADALEVFTTHRATETDTHWSAVHRALPGADLRVEMPTPETPAASARTEAFVLDAAATTAIVDDGTRAYSCSVEDLALTALGEAARRLTSQERLSVRLESHGRLEHDMLPPVDRTVGWFTSAYPVVLETTGDLTQRVLQTKELVRAVPDLGVGYSAAARVVDRADVTLTLNYIGSVGGRDAARGSTVGTPSAEGNRAFGGVSVVVGVEGDVLRVVTAVDTTVTTDRWFEAFVGALRAGLEDLAAHCRRQDGVHRTTSDLTSTDLDDDDLEALNALFG
ncbi:amino acid adenylation domain-containing protein [Curtobacterium flaccumfaciens]|uniref:amino acid adenylation domain-containing protein n=1 Tax=Curtobacterium flaccumfaciens TaxID=2035 RepID=UPI003D9A32B2